MREKLKTGVLGGDGRQKAVAARLAEIYECAVFGSDEVPLKAVRCSDWHSAVRQSDALVLPIPVTRDGLTLNTADEIALDDIAAQVQPGAVVFGGVFPPLFTKMIQERGGVTVDVLESDAVRIKNAVPTAEGTIAALISEMPTTVYGMSVTVTGYGAVARALCSRLVSLGAVVYVVARRVSALAQASTEGCVPVPLAEYLACPHDSDVIVNTVPALLFDEKVVGMLDPSTVYFELAGGVGGIDGKAAEQNGVRIVRLPSLPAKTAPETAGAIVAEEIIAQLSSRFGDNGKDGAR